MHTIIIMLGGLLGIVLTILGFLKLRNIQLVRRLHYEEYRERRAIQDIRDFMYFFGFDTSELSDEIIKKASFNLSERIKTTGVDAGVYAKELIRLNGGKKPYNKALKDEQNRAM